MGYAFGRWSLDVRLMIADILEEEYGPSNNHMGVAQKIFDALHPSTVAC